MAITSMSGPPLSVAHLTALHLPPPALAAAAAEAGFRAIGLRLAPAAPGAISYPLPAGSRALADMQSRMAGEGVSVHDVEFIPLTPDLDLHAFEPVLVSGAELGARTVTVSGDDPDRGRLVDTFARLCGLARPYGLRVEIEFMIWRYVGRLSDALAVVEAAGVENGGVLLDALHLARSGGSPANLADAAPGRIRGAQLCDAPAESPPPDGIVEEARTRRLPPGDGELPLRELVRALGRDVAYSVEVPAPPSVDLASHLRGIREKAEQVLAARDV